MKASNDSVKGGLDGIGGLLLFVTVCLCLAIGILSHRVDRLEQQIRPHPTTTTTIVRAADV